MGAKKKKRKEMSITASEWIGHGTGRVIRRDALEQSHPESWISLWIKKYGSADGFPVSEGHMLMTCPCCEKVSQVRIPEEV
jgi:hypothetical protein